MLRTAFTTAALALAVLTGCGADTGNPTGATTAPARAPSSTAAAVTDRPLISTTAPYHWHASFDLTASQDCPNSSCEATIINAGDTRFINASADISCEDSPSSSSAYYADGSGPLDGAVFRAPPHGEHCTYTLSIDTTTAMPAESTIQLLFGGLPADEQPAAATRYTWTGAVDLIASQDCIDDMCTFTLANTAGTLLEGAADDLVCDGPSNIEAIGSDHRGYGDALASDFSSTIEAVGEHCTYSVRIEATAPLPADDTIKILIG